MQPERLKKHTLQIVRYFIFLPDYVQEKKEELLKILQWHKSFITKAIQHKRDIVPAYFSGRNSDFFYNLSNFRKFIGIKANIEMLYLADEMFRQKDKEIRLVFGKPIPWQTFDKSKSAPEWAEWVKSKSYDLESFISVITIK